MTTAAVAGSDPLARARDAIGLALGVVAPDAVLHSDGSVRLRNSRNRLSRRTMRRLDQRLARRASAISAERLVVEATALVGAELDRARGGTPADGAAQALDALLDVPELSGSMRAETQAMLLTVLEGEPLLTDSALQRLMAARAQARAAGRPPLVADTVGAARSISRDAESAGRPPTAPPAAGRQSTGVLGRFRSALGARARRVQERNDEYRRLSNEWREIRLGVQVNASERAAVPSTPVERLRAQVRRQIAGLEAASADQTARADAKTASAAAATDEASDMVLAADAQEDLKDDSAAERARRLRNRAGHMTDMAGRHIAIAAACTATARLADEARDAYQVLLTQLEAAEAGPELAALAQAAGDKVDAYQAAAEATLPSKDVQHNALPSGRLPHLTALCRELNSALPDQYQLTPDFLHRILRAETRRVLSPDGFVLTIGNDPRADVDRLIQIEFKLDPGELMEVLDSPVVFDEAQVGQVVQGGFNPTTAVTDAATLTAGGSLQTALAAFPESSLLKAASQVVSPGLEYAIGRSHTVSGGATEYGQLGAIEALRGEIPRYRSTHPRWSWRLRTSATGAWSPEQVVDSGERHDAATLELGYSHSYSVGPPTDTVSLDTLGLPGERRTTTMPEHMATRVDGLNELCDEAVAGLRQRLGSLDRVGHDQLRGLIVEDGTTWLDESTKPGGIGRLITSGGRAVAYAQLETFAVPDTDVLLSDSSPEHKLEQWRMGYTGVSGGQTFGASNTVTATLGYPGTALSDLGTTAVDLGPGIRAGRNTGREIGTSTSDVGTRWSTHRRAPTVAVKRRLQHRVTIHRLDRDESFGVSGEGDACLRMLEQDAFRHGFPVPPAALVRDEDGNLRRGTDGRLLLRGDPQPTDEELKLPVWLGNGPGQLRGAGPAMIRDFQGADPALRALIGHLVDQEMIPPVDPQTGRLLLHRLTDEDPDLVASQLANFQHVNQQLTKHRLETGYDQAPQTGLLFELTKHRSGVLPEVHSYRIAVDQHFDRAKPLGVSTSDMVVNGDMGMNSTNRVGGRSKSLPWSARLGFSNPPGEGQAGSTPDVGPRYGRNALGRYFGWTSGSSLYRMSITETQGPVAVFDIPHTITVTEVTAEGRSETVAEFEGSAEIGFDRDFCDNGRPPALSVAGQVDPDLLQTATVHHVDARDPASRLVAAVPELGRGDGAALHHVTGFLGVRNLVTRPELLTSEHRTGLVVDATGNRRSLSVTSRVENLKYVGSGAPIITDMNMMTGDTSSTTGVSTSSTAAISAGSGMAGADGGSVGGTLGVSRTGSASATGTDTASMGVERTLMRDGEHYQFWGDLVLESELRSAGAEPHTIELDNGAVLLTLPERDVLRSYGQGKLDLPLEKVSDAVERLLDDNLSLPRRTTTALIRRYRIEKAGVTEGLAATHTDERLADKVRQVAGLAKGPQDRLAAVLSTAEEITRQRVEVRLPRHYQNTLGAALIERTSLEDLDGNDTDLLRQVYAAIEERSPSALDDPVLATGLRGDLAGVRWRGHVDDMLDPGGYVREYPIDGRNLRVRVRLVFDGPVTTDGVPDPGHNENAFNFMQLWNFRGQRRNATAGRSYGGSIGAAAADGESLSAGLTQDRGTSTTASSNHVNTRISEALWLDTRRVERDYRVIVEVEETPVAAGGRQPRIGRRADPNPVRRESTGRMAMVVPASVINAAPERPRSEVTDHRPIQLPADYIVEGTQPFVTGAEPVNNLFTAVYRRLGRSDMLTSAGVRMHKAALENMLGASARMAAFHELTGSGHKLVPLAVPGHSARVVAVRVRAEVSGLELISDPDDDSTAQIGANTRDLWTTGLTTKSNRRQPTGRNLSGSDPDSGLTAGGSKSVQLTEAVTGTTGARHEVGSYESSQVVTVKVNLDYHLDVERRTVDRHNNSKADRTDTVHRAAGGEAYLTMFRRDYDEMRARMEAGQPPLRGWDPSTAPKPVKTATVKGVVDEQRPYQSMVDALARARREGVNVRLTLRSPNGHKQVYVAAPDGTMTARRRDDVGFAAAFATLHPRLAPLAEGRVDLRALYDSGIQDGRFTGAVVEALQREGIPAAALTEADSTLQRPGHPAPETETHGAQQRGHTAGPSGAGIIMD